MAGGGVSAGCIGSGAFIGAGVGAFFFLAFVFFLIVRFAFFFAPFFALRLAGKRSHRPNVEG